MVSKIFQNLNGSSDELEPTHTPPPFITELKQEITELKYALASVNVSKNIEMSGKPEGGGYYGRDYGIRVENGMFYIQDKMVSGDKLKVSAQGISGVSDQIGSAMTMKETLKLITKAVQNSLTPEERRRITGQTSSKGDMPFGLLPN